MVHAQRRWDASHAHWFALCCPPSTTRQVPVIPLVRSDAAKTITSATSSGVPMRPHGIVASTAP